MTNWSFPKRTTTFVLWAFASMLVGAFVYGTIDRTVIVSEEMVVIPGKVASETWSLTEQTLISDLSEESLYQDYAPANSAYIDAQYLESLRSPQESDMPPSAIDTGSADLRDGGEATTTDDGEVTSGDTGGTVVGEGVAEEVSDEPSATEEVADQAGSVSETDAVPLPPTDPEPEPTSEPEPEPEPEPAEEVAEVVSWGLAPALQRFPLAQAVVTDYVTTTEEVVATPPVLPVDQADEEVDITTSTDDEGAETVPEAEVVSEETVEESLINGETATDEVVEMVEETTGDDSESDPPPATTTEEVEPEDPEVVFSPLDACAGYENCQMYPVTWSGFEVPEFESGKFLSNVELRLSLGAQAKTDKGPQQFVVEYRYEVEGAWRTATIIDIEEEVSNSLNGGYFLVALDKPLSQAQIAALEVRVSYLGDVSALERAYIESVWLELTSSSFYEENDPYYGADTLAYQRDLLMPQFHELTVQDFDVSIEELPAFTLSYSPQQGFFKRLATAVFGENTYQVETVRLVDAHGEVLDVPFDVIYRDDKVWTIEFKKQPQKMLPGKYRLEIVVNENDTRYVDALEFYWGVLAVNTTKGRYFSGEEVTFNLAALTDKGDTICDAVLELKVIDPEGVISEVPVEQSGACAKNNVTDIPDYLATFSKTATYGRYTIQLRHLNQDGEVVHKIEDHFTVEEYIPFVIERTAPTRIYPPAPYDVSIKVTANRTYTGDIVEYVPRGFVISEAGEAEIETLPGYSRLIWRNIELAEGDEIELSYKFDAPDISPYLYLLGPLDMDGYTELRQWQVASDALTAIGWFTGTRTVAGTNLNQAASPLQWSTSTIDTYYFSHSTSTNSHEVTIRQAGDYYLAVTLPQQRTDANTRGTRVGVEVRVNGVSVPEGVGRSGYIDNEGGQAESSTHIHYLLTNLAVDDVVTVYAEGLTTINAADIVNVTGKSSLYLEYIGIGAGVFAATTTRTTNSTNLNQTTEYAMQWTETRQDSGFTHSDVTNSEQIIIANPGTYLVQVNIPLTTDSNNTNIRGRVLLDGALVPGGHFKQGYGQAPATESDPDSSIHFTGIVVATTTNQVLTVTAIREGNAGTVTVTTGLVGSIFVRQLPTTDLIALRGTAVVGGTNWNPAAAAAIQWSSRDAIDTGEFTHSTSSNSHQITIASDGDYYLSYNDALQNGVTRANSRVSVLKNGTAISGAQTKTHYIRNQNAHSESSAALVTLLEGLVIGDVITVTVQQEAAAGTLDDSTDGVLLMWKKATLNLRPEAPSMYNAPFDNIRFASTTPYFDFSVVDPDGTSPIEYEFSISTSSSFSASTTYNSGVDTEFFNTASSTDTSPFTEGDKIRFQLTSGDALTDLTTYYWRVRARDTAGSNEFGDWSTTQSLTVDLAQAAPSWYQSYSGQFEGDTLVGTVSSGADRVQVDASESSDVLLAYGEGTVTTPRYRIWNGTSWSTEGSAQAVNGTINWVATAAGVTRDEYVLGTVDASSRAYAQIYSASTSSWGNLTLLATGMTGPAYRGVAVGYESTSGDAMAVSCSNGPNLVYRIWNGSTWSATSTIVVNSLNNCNYVQMASDPASDEIIVVTRDTGTQYEAFVWDGTTWVDSQVIGSSALVAREGIAVAYETSGDQAVIAVSNNTANSIAYTTWNGVEFSVNSTQTIGNDFAYGKLVADPNSDELALCYVDADSDIGVLRWNGGVWSTFTAATEIEATANSSTARPVDCVFETAAGRTDYTLAVYSDTVNVRYRTATSTTWATEASVDTIEDSFWVRAERAGDGTVVSVSLDDAADILVASRWNGSSWSTKETLEATLSSTIAAPYEIFDMAAKRFQFSEGVVETPPIDFTAVPNQPTWGDISFDTSEPFGTDVQVRVRYSSSTVCDAYIPDIALPGNSGGFDVSEVPIDLTGLSTSTYDQICLEATLTTQGSQSAALEEWTLSWVRQPKLNQSNYRWYVNGSFLTPTDPWPSGIEDLSENTALTSATAISVNEAIRLRIALQGVNVALPAFTEAFKLQYAEGLTCSGSLTWKDVGDAASTTALWRGYENAIVGDDWYSSSWQKRVKLTIPSTVVGGTVTDFPVYVNLANLPSSFFSSVQADGDDIRVTESDGVTEVPYELVSIDTSGGTGELHFRATSLSTSSDTSFFLYYGNGSASGYAVTATYGRNNVWSNGFLAVYHLDQSPTATAPQFVDSTGNSQGTAQNMEAGDRLSGIVGRYQNIDGTNEYIDLGATFNRTFLRSTWQIWASTTVTQGAYDGVLFSRATGETSGINISSVTGRLGYHWRDAANTWSWTGGPTYATTSEPFMATLLVEPTQAVLWRHAGSGVASGTNAVTHATATIAALDIGQDPNGGRLFTGGIDEASISNVVRSAGWLTTTFNNKSNPSGFYTVSSEELINDGRLLPSTVLLTSDNPETYEEESPTRDNQSALAVGDEAEWDFVLQNNSATPNTNYCFRLVYEDGSQFNSYLNYPRVLTNAAPLTPVNSAPFDNERLASTTPFFEFAADDELGDEVAYQIQVSTSATFGSTVIDNDSVTNFALFTNLSQPSQKSTFTPGETIQYIPTTSLSNGTTYWWRVRAIDPDGSNSYSEWSTPTSFTVNTATVITTWFQTTGNQFATNNHIDATSSVSTNDVGIESGFTAGTTTSTVIDYDDRDTGNAWGQFSFTDNETSGTIDYYIEYRVSGETFALVPDAVLPGNSSGFNTSPVSLVGLDTDTYNELRITAVLVGNATLPRLQDWTVTWSETIDVPTLDDPFDNAKVGTTTPSFLFFTSDPENNDLQYEFQISSSYGFTSSSTFLSGVDAGFTNTEVATDTSPFFTDDVIRYTAQSALTNGNTYWWRVRARDPGGSNTWSNYSDPQSFTVDTSITTSVWHQTTGEQFDTDSLVDIETIAGGAQITSTIREVMTVYGEGTGQAPQYRLWNGTSWSAAASAQSVGAQITWLELEASPARPEYALATLGTDLDVNVQIFDGANETWGDVKELDDNSGANNKRGFNIAYESLSGDLMAVACDGTEAVYAIWNGTSWTATSSIALSNTNNCEYISIASDPTSDEIIAVFRHTNTSATDYEALVWSGSAWGNSTQLGNIDLNTNEGMAVGYEESGGQAIVTVSNNALTTLLYTTWNGTSWSTQATTTLGDRLEWATLKSDVGTDRMALCYQDNDTDVGVIFWDGSAWGTFSELDIDGNADNGRAIDCEFETEGSRDGYLMVGYSDTIGTRYQSYATSTPSGEVTLDTITDTTEIQMVRTGDGLLMLSAYDDAQTPDRIDHSRWNGTLWSTRESFTTNASLNGLGIYNGGSSMAAQLYPNFTSGSIRSTAIDFADGTGPRWDFVSWNDTTPGASLIEYRVYYESAPGVFTLIPESALPGNSAGFTTSPIDISNVNRTTYSVLQLDAQLLCDSGDCPSLQDWSVAWSEGVTVSGIAREYDETSTTTSGTVAVAVNGVLQTGKTGTVLGDGTWSISNVTVFPDDTVTVFVDGATDANEAVAIATYNGVGNMTGLELTKRHVTIGGASAATTTNASFAGYDFADDEDIFFTVGVGNLFTLCADTACGDAILTVKSGTQYLPGANATLVTLKNYGTFSPATNTIRIAGAWNNQGTFNESASTIIFTATTSSTTLVTATSTLRFYNATFGETSGSASWSIGKTLTVLGNLAVNYGTLTRGTSSIALEGNLSIGASGGMSGLGTTTFNGSGSYTWSDAKASASSTNVGHVVVDGTAKTITLAGNVGAQSVTIGTDDTLNSSASGYNINVYSNWTNNNSFVPQNGTVSFVGTSTGLIARGTSAFNNLTFSGAGGTWSFSTSTLTVNGNLTIATGTVTLPTGTTTIAGSFSNTGGTFLHNNGEVRMTSTVAGRTITQSGTAFLNAFYDLVFAGSGSWSFTEANATTSRDLRIQSGTVTFPSGQLTIGGDLSVTGSGAFAHNNGEVVLLVQEADVVRTNGSSLNNVRVKGGSSSSWYSSSWSSRVPVTVESTQVGETVTDFPVYVNLANLPATFFSTVATTGADIRVTAGDGYTEVPYELVSLDTSGLTGELHFKAPTVSASSDTTFYIYYGNSAASAYSATSTYGRNNVWTNGYLAVYHLNESPTASAPQYVSSNNTLTGTSNNMEAGDRQAAQIGFGQALDGTDEFIQTTFNSSMTTSTWSVWMRPSGAQGARDGVLFSRGTSVSGLGYNSDGTRLSYHWNNTAATYDWNGAPVAPTNEWFMASLVVQPTTATMYLHASSGHASGTNTTTHTSTTIDDLKFGQDDAGGRFFNGLIDEVRLASVARTGGWLLTEYNNHASTTSFYTVGGAESRFARTFSDTNATILGNYVAEAGGEAVFPTGVLSVGGSFTNGALFTANGGTVRFNSTAGSETVTAGSSSFATLEFNSSGGIFTVAGHATATTAINLTNASSFTVSSGISLASAGTFTNALLASTTTWTGSTLRLVRGAEMTLNAKTHGGDTYGTIEAASSTLVKMWNSSATSYTTLGTTSAIYSQDHAAVDGDLYIYGNYVRTSGTEHWSYATDFDGTALGSTSRQVDVRLAANATTSITSGSQLAVLGSASASTTINAISGSFGLVVSSSTLNAEYFTVANTATSGLALLSSTTIGTFKDAAFTVPAGRTGITIDGSTIDMNAADQYLYFSFATSSPGSATNVTLSGTSTNYVWFRTGTGTLYGEAYDAGDTDPGAIRFDDSSYIINISGVVYSDDGATPMGAPTCDGATPNVRIVVDGGTYTNSVACNAGTGAFTFTNVAYIGDPSVVIYLNTNGGQRGSVVTKTPTTNITNMNIYANRVIVRHEDVAPLTIVDMIDYDYADDTDIAFVATDSAPDTLTTIANTELYVWGGKTFAPGGNVTLSGNGNSNSYEGTLSLGTSATFTATGTETHTLAGRFVLGSGATFTPASSTVVFNATTTGKSITGTSTITFNELLFAGTGGGWNIGANLSILGDMEVASGTVTGTSNVTLENGSLFGNGTLSFGAGTTTLARTNTLGGATPWTFYNLALGNGTSVGTTTPAGTATTTILNRFTIANAHFLDAGNSVWDFAGTGSVFTENGTFLEDTSTVRYSGAGANVRGTNYYNLIAEAGVGSATYTTIGSGFLILNDLTVGGAATSLLTFNGNDPIVEVYGDVQIAANGTLVGSNSANLLVRSSWLNDGVFTHSSGTVRFTGSATTNIAAGNSTFATVEIDGTGTFTVTEHATATVAWRLINHDLFTLASGQSLAVGGDFLNNLAGADTTWTGSNLILFGLGTYDMNDSATTDAYETLTVASGTHARMWNSTATAYAVASNGSLYSQDHASVNGDLYIYGQMVRTVGDDYWSYDTDFDGTDLSGGSERAANVYFANGASATWTGGSLSVIGTSSASTTISNQGSGTYGLTIGGTATTDWSNVVIRDVNATGINFTGTPTVSDFSYTDHLVEINNATAVTVAGTVIDANPAKNFTNNLFAESGGVTTPKNVTATGSTVSSWRFTNHFGNIAGEAFDSDPTGDPGYLVWDDSAALITVAGNVYSDEGVTVSAVCDGVTNNVRLVVAGLTTYDTTCNATTGAYSISGVAFSPLDTLTLYINGETERAANVSVAPISSISNMHLYENRVIVRHENSDPLTIANMAVWDSSDDADIPFTAVDAGSDTLSIPANYKLLVWAAKTFAPAGAVTVSGGGAGAAYDGTLEVQTNGTFRAAGTESHSVGGSVILGTGASYVAASSTLTLTTTGASRTFDVNSGTLHNLAVTGSGSWSVTDATLTLTGSYTQSAGALTLPTGTTTVAAAFNVTGGSVVGSATPFLFTSSGAGNAVRFNNSTVGTLTFNGSGSWSMNDTNATTTGSVIVSRGTLTLPTGNLAVGQNFLNLGGSVTHNTADIIMTATSTATLTASSSTLYAVRFTGGGAFTLGDVNLTLADSFAISSGSVAIGTGTLSVAGSFTATGGTFTHASGTVLLNAGGAGRTIDPGTSAFYNLQIGAPAGGYTLYSATTTNNFTIANVNSLTVNPGSTIRVYGVFLNSVGGAATTWTGSTLSLLGQSAYSINGRTNSGDTYATLTLGPNADVRMWYSSAATTTVDGSSSLYSQDHANVNGDLYIYGDLVVATTTEYWSYATDFDGTSLSGTERAVNVYLAPNATTTVTTGTLNIVGGAGNATDVTNMNLSSTHAIIVSGGTLNADRYTMARLDAAGLQLSGLSTITNLANGSYTLAVNGGSLITLSSTTLNANPSKTFDNVGFATTTAITGYNVTLVGETPNAWRFTNNYGNIGGEAFDVDGVDACGSVRFDDSACLLTEQTHFRWRADNGGEGAPDSEWYDPSWAFRSRVRILNNDAVAYASTAVKIAVAYDSGMQSNFADLRFTAEDGVTPVPYWVEKYTASTDAQVWVRIPTLPASDHATIFMYYGNGSASSTSSGTTTFDAFDDFEDNSLSEYSGDTSLFTPVTTPVYGGTYALGPNPTSGKTTDGIFRFDDTVAQGQMIRYMQYVNAGAAGNNDEPCTLFGVQSPGTTNQNYAVCLERFGVDRLSLAENVQNNDTSGTVLATTTVTYSTGWYEVVIDWRTTNQIIVSLYNSSGTFVASTSATDSSYTSGGFGYAYWYQNGAWDSFTARARVATTPTVYFGAEQQDGGASWLAALDTAGTAVPNTIVRLRLAVENSGLDITNQQFRLEYAAKATAPTCESVDTGSYATVPNQASCGSSPVCMATSSNITNGAVTTDLLFGTNGTFTAGEIVTSPSSETTALSVNQDYYTELEYAVVPTSNASDAYCFRVTNAGTELDYYATVAELGLQFDPTLSAVTLNDGLPISLTPGTTTAVVASTSVTDFNGPGDLAHATATIYRSGAGAGCAADNNNCYILSTTAGTCSFSNCTSNTCTLSCEADIFFHADPTDASTYEGEEWLAYVEVEDTSAGYDFASAPGVELITLRALQVDSLINYGSLEPNSNTGSTNASTTITNLGNAPLNVDVEATDLSDGGTSVIPAEQQKMATSTFTYSACVTCYQLSSTTPITLGINLSKPSTVAPPVEGEVYWGIAVPSGINSAPHSGVNIFTAVGVP